MFGFKKKCLVCKMKEENGNGKIVNGNWFCSQSCINSYKQKTHKKECCH